MIHSVRGVSLHCRMCRALVFVAPPADFARAASALRLLVGRGDERAHPTGCAGHRGHCSHRPRTPRAGAGRLSGAADSHSRRLSRGWRGGHRGAALRRADEGDARAIRYRREPCRRQRDDRRRSRREVAARRPHAADGGLGRGRDQPTSLQGQDELRSAARARRGRAYGHRCRAWWWSQPPLRCAPPPS